MGQNHANTVSEENIDKLISYLEVIAVNSLLCDEKNFDQRVEAIEFIEFEIICQLEDLLQKTNQPEYLILLKKQAEKIKAELEAIDIVLFRKLRANIKTAGYRGTEFKNMVKEYAELDVNDTKHQEAAGYDNLDIFINGLLNLEPIPEPVKELEPDMVFYQKTPARIIFELAERVRFTNEDVFFDLGSGLGQAAILVNLFTGVKTIGIEFEPAFRAYAANCCSALNLQGLDFINTDARQANYSEGTVFFMFTPFKGEIMQEVLAALLKESLKRKIKIITYGPCTAEMTLQNWLAFEGPECAPVYKLAVFTSL